MNYDYQVVESQMSYKAKSKPTLLQKKIVYLFNLLGGTLIITIKK